MVTLLSILAQILLYITDWWYEKLNKISLIETILDKRLASIAVCST